MTRRASFRRGAAAVAVAALALAGCATTSLVSDVKSYSQWPAERQPSTYSFERLPSQEADGANQASIESAARPALSQAGLKEVDPGDKADVTVQVGLRTARDARFSGWDDPFIWNGGLGYYGGYYGPWRRGWGWGWYPGMSMGYSTPRYEHEAIVLIRDGKDGKALYETRASIDNYGYTDETTLSAMFAAALKDFPRPAISPRRVTVPLAPESPASAAKS